MTPLDVAVLKPYSLVCYKEFVRKKYNNISKGNLKQYVDLEISSQLLSVSKGMGFTNLFGWYSSYQKLYYKSKGHYYLGELSHSVSKRLFKITSLFVNSIIKRYNPLLGYFQRIVTFSTFTLTEPQKHCDKTIISLFVDFLDHLKKVKNFVVGTDKETFRLKNYVWRAEAQENGNIHFHLISDCYLNKTTLQFLWNKYLLKLGYKPSNNSAYVESLKKGKDGEKISDIEKYLCKYMTKPALKNDFKHLSQKEAKKVYELTLNSDAPVNPYRRAIIGKVWGCSKPLLNIDFPKFYDMEIMELQELKNQMVEKKIEGLPEYLKYYSGNLRKLLKKCSYSLQKRVKDHYLRIFDFIYSSRSLVFTRSMWLKLERFCRENKFIHGCKTNDELLFLYNELKSVGWNLRAFFESKPVGVVSRVSESRFYQGSFGFKKKIVLYEKCSI